jgi:hypothetical protein
MGKISADQSTWRIFRKATAEWGEPPECAWEDMGSANCCNPIGTYCRTNGTKVQAAYTQWTQQTSATSDSWTGEAGTARSTRSSFTHPIPDCNQPGDRHRSCTVTGKEKLVSAGQHEDISQRWWSTASTGFKTEESSTVTQETHCVSRTPTLSTYTAGETGEEECCKRPAAAEEISSQHNCSVLGGRFNCWEQQSQVWSEWEKLDFRGSTKSIRERE